MPGLTELDGQANYESKYLAGGRMVGFKFTLTPIRLNRQLGNRAMKGNAFAAQD